MNIFICIDNCFFLLFFTLNLLLKKISFGTNIKKKINLLSFYFRDLGEILRILLKL